MANIRIRYFKFRNGRPRWEPGPHLRKAGWKGRNLKDDNGNWLDELAAARAAQEINAEVEQWKQQNRRPGTSTDKKEGQESTPPKPPISEQRTMQALIDTWFSSPKFGMKAPKTQQDYRMKAAFFLKKFGDAPVKAISRSMVIKYWENEYNERGHHMANGIIAVIRAAFSHAIDHEWIINNPASELKLPTVKPRLVLWLPDEITHFVQTAQRLNLHSVADAFIIALHTGQRRADVLTMPDCKIENNLLKFRQRKTGARVDIPMTPQLAARIEQIRERKSRAEITSLAAMVIYEGTGQPYKGDLFSKKFALVRKEAAKELPEIAARKFLDLRDTAVTRLFDAPGNDITRVCAITGHKLESAHQIMKHYLQISPDMASQAIKNLVADLEEKGIEL